VSGEGEGGASDGCGGVLGLSWADLRVLWTVIPKEHTVFKFEIPQPPRKGAVDEGVGTGEGQGKGEGEGVGLRSLVFELHGSQFENRAPERATKKFKQRNMSDL